MSRVRNILLISLFFAGYAASANVQAEEPERYSCNFSEPASSNCMAPRPIPGSVGHHVVLMDVQTATDTGTMCDPPVPVGHKVYFSLRPDVTGWVTASTCHPATAYDTVLQVATGVEFCETGTVVGCNDDTGEDECPANCGGRASKTTFYAYAGQDYIIRVGSYNSNPSGCFLCLGLIVTIGTPCGDPPREFLCQIPHELPGTPGTHYAEIDVEGAPSNVHGYQCLSGVGHHVWFSFVPTISGFAAFSTCVANTTYNTVVQALVGDCSGTMYTRDCNDNSWDPECDNECGGRGSKVSFSVDAGQTYYLEVGAVGDNSDDCDLCLGGELTIGECSDASHCDDGNPCTEDVCEGGMCAHNALPSYTPCPDDGESCTDDYCYRSACIHPDKADYTACGDQSNTDCTDPDMCLDGTCLPRHASYGTACTPDSNECTSDICDGSGSCIHPNAAAGTPCGDPSHTDCTDPDTCNGAGTCVANHLPYGSGCYADANECTNDICNAGVCTHPPSAYGLPCGDQSTTDCTNPDTCNGAGTCLANHLPYGSGCYADANECTNDICNTGVCTHPAAPAGTPCGDPSDTACDDPDACDGAGTCLSRNEPPGTPCPDGLFCNGEETCNAQGTCQPGAPPCLPEAFCDEAGDFCGSDCNDNGIEDLADIESGHSIDCNHNGIPDECEPGRFCALVNQEVQPDVNTLPGLGGGPERAVCAVRAPDGTRDQFVTNEVILYAPIPGILEVFAETYGADVLQGGTLPAPPDSVPPEAVRPEYASSDYHLLRVDLSLADMANFEQYMEELAFEGVFEFSSEDGVRLSAIVAKERVVTGLNVTPNVLDVSHDAQCVLSETEEQPLGAGVFRDGFAFDWISDAELLVSRAWQYVDLLSLPNPNPLLGLVDCGFALNADFPPLASVPQYDHVDDDYDALDPGWSGFHGTGAASTAAARLDNQFGSVGTGGQVAMPMFFKVAGESGVSSFFATARGIRTATYWGAEVINVSRGGECGWWCRNFGVFSGMDALTDVVSDANSAGAIVVASAGNDELDLDDTTVISCEIDGVLCVGAIETLSKDAVRGSGGHHWGSNYGSKVDIWAPGDAINTTPNPLTGGSLAFYNGTSAASPYVAGIVTLMKAIDPNLTPSQAQTILQNTANESPDARVTPGFVNAYEAVRATAVAAGLTPQNDSFEPNDTEPAAYALPSNATSFATITPGDTDYYFWEPVDYMDLHLWVVYRERHVWGNALNAVFDQTTVADTNGLYNFDQTLLKPGRRVLSVFGRELDSINCYRIERTMSPSTIDPDQYDDETPWDEPRNDTFADAAPMPETLHAGISGETLRIRDLNHDTNDDTDYFTVQLGPAEGGGDGVECCDSPEPDTTQGGFKITVVPHVVRPFYIKVFNSDGTVFAYTSGLSLSFECPHIHFPDGEITFSVRDATSRNFYEVAVRYNHCYTQLYPEWFLAFDPPVFRRDVDEIMDSAPWLFPGDPQVQEDYFNGTATEPFPDEYLLFDRQQAGQYVLDVQLPSYCAGAGCLDVTLIDFGGDVLGTADWITGGRDQADEVPTKRLDVPDLPPGTYFLKLEGGAFGTRFVLNSIELGDLDGDHDVDLRDVAAFQMCFGGQGGQPLTPECQIGDLNGDGHIDLQDLALLATVLGGPRR